MRSAIPLSADPDAYLPDSHIGARCIMNTEGYYIAYFSAMNGIWPILLPSSAANARVGNNK